MKKTILLAILLGSAIGVYAQGTVQFVNNGTGFRAKVYGVETTGPQGVQIRGNSSTDTPAGSTVYTGAILSGTGFTAALWGHVGTGVPEATLQQLATTTFRTGTAAGIMTAATAVVPNSPADGTSYSGTFQVRAWDNRNGTITSWAQVLADATIPRGTGDVFEQGPLGGTGTPPATAPIITNMRGFNLYAVPEPSVIALGALGLGALLLRRVRK